MDKFILVAKRPKQQLNNGTYRVRVTPEAFNTLDKWSMRTGESMTELLSRAIDFAAERAVVVDEFAD